MKPLSSSSLMKRMSTKSSGLAAFALGSVCASGSKMFLIPSSVGYCFAGAVIVSADIIIGLFQDLLVLQREVFRQYSSSRLAVRLNAVNSLNLRFDIPLHHVGNFTNARGCRSRAQPLAGYAHTH